MEKEYILKCLCEIEQKYDVSILLAVESGSRAWGFASKDSDWDVRFIYKHGASWYFSIEEQRDVIEEMLENDIDAVGWDIKKALFQLKRSNPALIEWINSPIVYCSDDFFMMNLIPLARFCFNPTKAMYHYQRIYVKHDERYLQKQGYGTLQRIQRMIVHFPVIGRQHHILLITLEDTPDVIHPVLHGRLPVTLLLLHLVRPAVQRQDEETDHNAHTDDGQSCVIQHPVHHREDNFNHQFKRHYDQLIQKCQHFAIPSKPRFPVPQNSSCLPRRYHRARTASFRQRCHMWCRYSYRPSSYENS